MATPINNNPTQNTTTPTPSQATGAPTGELNGHSVSPIDTNAAADSTAAKSSCNWKTGLKCVAISLIVVGLVAGVGGLLVYLGQMHIGLEAAGMMSTTTGFYTAIAGFGLSFVLTLLYTASCWINKAKDAKDEATNNPPVANAPVTPPPVVLPQTTAATAQ